MNTNPFEFLGVPVAFDVDQKLLHQRMIQLAAVNHPDRYQDPLDQADAAERSAEVNEAYRLLKAPMSRAALLLKLLSQGVSLDEKALPPELLMAMMETREELEEALANKDQSTLDRLRQWADQQQAQYTAALGEALSGALAVTDDAGDCQALLQKAQVQLNALRYIHRMLEEFP